MMFKITENKQKLTETTQLRKLIYGFFININ